MLNEFLTSIVVDERDVFSHEFDPSEPNLDSGFFITVEGDKYPVYILADDLNYASSECKKICLDYNTLVAGGFVFTGFVEVPSRPRPIYKWTQFNCEPAPKKEAKIPFFVDPKNTFEVAPGEIINVGDLISLIFNPDSMRREVVKTDATKPNDNIIGEAIAWAVAEPGSRFADKYGLQDQECEYDDIVDMKSYRIYLDGTYIADISGYAIFTKSEVEEAISDSEIPTLVDALKKKYIKDINISEQGTIFITTIAVDHPCFDVDGFYNNWRDNLYGDYINVVFTDKKYVIPAEPAQPAEKSCAIDPVVIAPPSSGGYFKTKADPKEEYYTAYLNGLYLDCFKLPANATSAQIKNAALNSVDPLISNEVQSIVISTTEPRTVYVSTSKPKEKKKSSNKVWDDLAGWSG